MILAASSNKLVVVGVSVDMEKMGNYVGDKVNPVKNVGRMINVINAFGDGMKDQKQKYDTEIL